MGKRVIGIVGAIAAVIGSVAVSQVVMPQVRVWQANQEIDRLVNENPAFQQIAKHEPAVYQQFEQQVKSQLTTAVRENKSQAEIEQIAYKAGAEQLSPIFTKYLPVASDDALIQFGNFITETASNPNTCGALVGNDRFTSDNLPPEQQEKVYTLMANVIQSGAENPVKLGDRAPAEAAITKIAQAMYQTYGDDLKMLDAPNSPTSDQTKVCTMMSDLYKRVLALPKGEGAATLRMLLSQS